MTMLGTLWFGDSSVEEPWLGFALVEFVTSWPFTDFSRGIHHWLCLTCVFFVLGGLGVASAAVFGSQETMG